MAFTAVAEQEDSSMCNNLYVRGFENDFTEDDLVKKFSEFGEISSHTMSISGFAGKKFGFVCFEKPEDA